MLRRLYRWAVRLHPSSFRRRFGDEMLYIFDQQEGMLAALGVMLDCLFSLLRQWTLRPQIGVKQSAAALQNPVAGHTPLFETFDTFPPRTSAMIYGALVSLILLNVIIFAIPYSGIHFSSQHMPWTVANPAKASGAPAEPAQTRGATIWLDPYVGKYVSKNPPENIWIQIEGDAPRKNHLSISMTAAGHSGVAITPLSPTRFVILGARNSYVDFTHDAQGGIRSLSLVVNDKAVTARRE